jgi:TetR/AcrR family transcriptional repressor of nem operon
VRYGPSWKEESRQKIIAAAGRGFRRLGYGGIGVDALAKEANVTSGAFYGHFPSKADAFRAIAVNGLVELREGIERVRVEAGDAWLDAFVDFYLSVRRTCELGESCALQSLTPDVIRADDETKTGYQTELLKVVDAVAAGLKTGTASERQATAWVILSILSGGVTLARSMTDPSQSAAIAAALKSAVLALSTR